MKLLNGNRSINYKYTKIEFCYISATVLNLLQSTLSDVTVRINNMFIV